MKAWVYIDLSKYFAGLVCLSEYHQPIADHCCRVNNSVFILVVIEAHHFVDFSAVEGRIGFSVFVSVNADAFEISE